VCFDSQKNQLYTALQKGASYTHFWSLIFPQNKEKNLKIPGHSTIAAVSKPQTGYGIEASVFEKSIKS
jgi:hypothetical protein